MNLIGFNFTKVSGEVFERFEQDYTVSTGIEFLDVSKDTITTLNNLDALKLKFEYKISYSLKKEEKKEGNKTLTGKPKAEIAIAGEVIFSADKEEVKDIMKAWKKKDLPISVKIPVYNLIMKKSLIKAVQIQDELVLPVTVPIPQLAPKYNEEQSQ